METTEDEEAPSLRQLEPQLARLHRNRYKRRVQRQEYFFPSLIQTCAASLFQAAGPHWG